eukprot:6373803-Amphidinium_carterae.1
MEMILSHIFPLLWSRVRQATIQGLNDALPFHCYPDEHQLLTTQGGWGFRELGRQSTALPCQSWEVLF